MKALSIGLGLFILTGSAGAGTFVESFDANGRSRKSGGKLTRFWLRCSGSLGILLMANFSIYWPLMMGGLTRLLTTGDEMWQDLQHRILMLNPLRKHGDGKTLRLPARISQTWGVVCTIGDLPFPEPEINGRAVMAGNFAWACFF